MLPVLQPMLAVAAAPFDAAGYCFEIKWDGVRTLAAVDAGGGRLWGRDLYGPMMFADDASHTWLEEMLHVRPAR